MVFLPSPGNAPFSVLTSNAPIFGAGEVEILPQSEMSPRTRTSLPPSQHFLLVDGRSISGRQHRDPRPGSRAVGRERARGVPR